jgi:demethylmenaquinone methyltransferase/2-methoxy-6-polyprenyl-1,4-benzoquinol methylase
MIHAVHKKQPSLLEIENIYDKIAPFYDFWGNLTESKARKRALLLSDIKDGQNILEVATGSGLLFHDILKRNPNGFTKGLDLSSAMIAKTKKKATKISATNFELQVGTAQDLPYEDSEFDLLFNNYMFDLLPEIYFNRVLQEFHRVMKSGAKLILLNMAPGRHQR